MRDPAAIKNVKIANFPHTEQRQVCTLNHTILYILQHFLVDLQTPFLRLR